MARQDHASDAKCRKGLIKCRTEGGKTDISPDMAARSPDFAARPLDIISWPEYFAATPPRNPILPGIFEGQPDILHQLRAILPQDDPKPQRHLQESRQSGRIKMQYAPTTALIQEESLNTRRKCSLIAAS
jgi:hypothetical protein